LFERDWYGLPVVLVDAVGFEAVGWWFGFGGSAQGNQRKRYSVVWHLQEFFNGVDSLGAGVNAKPTGAEAESVGGDEDILGGGGAVLGPIVSGLVLFQIVVGANAQG